MEPGPIPEVEVIEPARPGRRRRYSAEDKRRIVEETRVPGQSVSSVSRRFARVAQPGVQVAAARRGRNYVRPRRRRIGGARVGREGAEGADPRARAAAGAQDARERGPEGSDRDRARKKTVVALALAETGRFAMRVIASALALSRSNLIERRQRRYFVRRRH